MRNIDAEHLFFEDVKQDGVEQVTCVERVAGKWFIKQKEQGSERPR